MPDHPQQPGTADDGIDAVKGGWFTELGTLWPGQGLSIQIEDILLKKRSKFQDVCVFTSKAFGKILVLDGAIQVTDRDEFSYQEMITHLPLCALEHEPKNVLIVGGGDGGVAREVARHACVEKIDQAEIDGMVPEVSKQFFPELSVGYADPRHTLHITDGIKWVQDAPEASYDAIIVDSSDPVGPAQVLFERPFFEAMHRALKPGGVVSTQGESLWLHLDIIKELASMCQDIFKGGCVQYAYTTIPTYPSGQIGFMICTKAKSTGRTDPRIPRRTPLTNSVTATNANLKPLRYYNENIHKAAFVLPTYAEEALRPFLSE